MKNLFTALLVLACTGTTFGEPTSGSWGSSGKYQELYRSGSKGMFEGKVLRMSDVVPLSGMEPGMQIKLRGENGEIDVHLGPRWFVMQRDMLFTKGEPVVVVGVTIRLGDKPTVVADEIRRGDRKIILRELTGRPVWESASGKTVPE